MKTGIELIAEERARQMAAEGYTPEHDDAHDGFELTDAAVCYALYVSDSMARDTITAYSWPWDEASWNPSDDPVRNLVKAAALIAAEIDRLQRAQRKG